MSDLHEWNLATWEECGHGYKCSDGCPTCRITWLEEEVERLREGNRNLIRAHDEKVERLREDNRNLIRAHDEMSDQAQQEMERLRDEVRDLRQMHPCEKCQAKERETEHRLTRLVRRLEKIDRYHADQDGVWRNPLGSLVLLQSVAAAIADTQEQPAEENGNG